MDRKIRRLVLAALLIVAPTLSGQAVGPELRLNGFTTGFQGFPTLSPRAAGGFNAFWEGANQVSASTRSTFRQFDATGSPTGSDTVANAGSGSVGGSWGAGLSTGDFIVAWDQGLSGDVLMRRFSSVGAPLSGDTVAHETTAGGQFRPRVAAIGNLGFVVTFMSPDPSGRGTFARRFDAAGAPLAPEFIVNTTTAGNQFPARVAGAPQGSFVIVWPDTDGTIRGQLYVNGGALLGSEFTVGLGQASLDEELAVGMDQNGSFVVAWTGNDGLGTGILARRYAADGTPLGSEFIVNTHTLGTQKHPAVAVDPALNFVIAWEGEGPTDTTGIWARRYTPFGVPLGSAFQVNTSMDSAQTYPSATYVGGGSGFVVAWHSSHAGSESTDVYAQRYVVYGEITGDGGIDVFDVVTMMSFVVGNVTAGIPPFLGTRDGADVNRDTNVDVFDVVLLMGYIVGNVASLPV